MKLFCIGMCVANDATMSNVKFTYRCTIYNGFHQIKYLLYNIFNRLMYIHYINNIHNSLITQTKINTKIFTLYNCLYKLSESVIICGYLIILSS